MTKLLLLLLSVGLVSVAGQAFAETGASADSQVHAANTGEGTSGPSSESEGANTDGTHAQGAGAPLAHKKYHGKKSKKVAEPDSAKDSTN